jgi:poly-gamma-glutamate biosynthesis protein PgsC/CapC
MGIALGLFVSLACYLATNLSPGGMITPGWLALLLVIDPTRMIVVAGVVAATYLAVRGLRRFVIVFGKRLFATTVMIGVFLQAGLFIVLLDVFPHLLEGPARTVVADSTTLGFIVPGLLAYQLVRQPPVATLAATTVVTVITAVAILAGALLHVVPGSDTYLAEEETAVAFSVELSTPVIVGFASVVGLALLALLVHLSRIRASGLPDDLDLPPLAGMTSVLVPVSGPASNGKTNADARESALVDQIRLYLPSAESNGESEEPGPASTPGGDSNGTRAHRQPASEAILLLGAGAVIIGCLRGTFR